MIDYIRRDDAIIKGMEVALEGLNTPLKIKALFDEIPATDVVEVVHGEWWSAPIEQKEAGHKVKWDDLYPDCPAESCFCSVCGKWLVASDEYPVNGRFCPNCGADMREVQG